MSNSRDGDRLVAGSKYAVVSARRTMRCIGIPACRNQHALDVATLLDVDDTIISWSSRTPALRGSEHYHQPDFVADHTAGRSLVMAVNDSFDHTLEPALEAAQLGFDLKVYRPSDLNRTRLQNATDILTHGRFRVSLDERLRLLCMLDECSSACVAECVIALRSPLPMAALSSLFLHRIIEIDIDDTLIGPDTIVRRKRL